MTLCAVLCANRLFHPTINVLFGYTQTCMCMELVEILLHDGEQERLKEKQIENEWMWAREETKVKSTKNVLIACTYTDSLWFLPLDTKVELFRHFSSNEKLVYFIWVYTKITSSSFATTHAYRKIEWKRAVCAIVCERTRSTVTAQESKQATKHARVRQKHK